MNRLKLFAPLIIFAALAVLLYRGLSLDPKELPSALIGKPFPDFQLPALEQTKGTVTKQQVTGDIALVNVWATWCPSCKAEHNQLMTLADEGIKIIGINYKDERPAAKQWLQRLGNPYVFNIFDEHGSLGLDLGVFGAPETYLIDSAGRIVYKRVGVVDERIWQEELQPRIAQLRGQ